MFRHLWNQNCISQFLKNFIFYKPEKIKSWKVEGRNVVERKNCYLAKFCIRPGFPRHTDAKGTGLLDHFFLTMGEWFAEWMDGRGSCARPLTHKQQLCSSQNRWRDMAQTVVRWLIERYRWGLSYEDHVRRSLASRLLEDECKYQTNISCANYLKKKSVYQNHKTKKQFSSK